MKRFLIALSAAAALAVGLFASPSALADGHNNCGGQYLVSVEGDTGQGVTYCSDGTLSPFIPPDGDGTSSCGGSYPAAVEVDDVDLPAGAPVGSVSYCSDGTIEAVEDLAP